MAKKSKTEDTSNTVINTDDIPIREFKRNNTGALMTRFGKYYLLVSCNQVTDKKQIERFIRDYGIERPAQEHNVEAFGFRIYADTSSAKVFRNSSKPISTGRERWAFSLRRSSLEAVMVYGITLEVFEADVPHRVDFTTQVAIDAAMRVYRASVEAAEFELRKELLRITTNTAREYKNSIERPETPCNPNKSNVKTETHTMEYQVETKMLKADQPNPTKKRLVVFKKR